MTTSLTAFTLPRVWSSAPCWTRPTMASSVALWTFWISHSWFLPVECISNLHCSLFWPWCFSFSISTIALMWLNQSNQLSSWVVQPVSCPASSFCIQPKTQSDATKWLDCVPCQLAPNGVVIWLTGSVCCVLLHLASLHWNSSICCQLVISNIEDVHHTACQGGKFCDSSWQPNEIQCGNQGQSQCWFQKPVMIANFVARNVALGQMTAMSFAKMIVDSRPHLLDFRCSFQAITFIEALWNVASHLMHSVITQFDVCVDRVKQHLHQRFQKQKPSVLQHHLEFLAL